MTSANPTSPAPSVGQNRNMLLLGVILGVAAVAAVALILLSQTSSQQVNTGKYAGLQETRLPDGGFMVGAPDAPITIVEFADFACGHCQTYESTITQLVERYVRTGQARYEFRIFPTVGGELTAFIGNTLVCMEEQQPGIFWQASPILYQAASTGNYDGNTARSLANQFGVNYADALSCQQNQSHIMDNLALGREAGVNGTPAVRIRLGDGPLQLVTLNGQTYDRGGPSIEVLGAVIEAANQAS